MTTRHIVLTAADKTYLVSGSAAKIVQHLKAAGRHGLNYDELRKRTRSPRQSLYVFAQRLRDVSVVETKRNADGEVRLYLTNPKKTVLTEARRIG